MEVENRYDTSGLFHQRRTLRSPAAAVSRGGDVQCLKQNAASSPPRDVGKQAAEIARLVALAEQYAADDAERRRRPPSALSTTARPTPEQTSVNSSAHRQHTVAMSDASLAPTTTAAVFATAPSDTRRRRAAHSAHLLDIKSLPRCPKCHKIRIDVGSVNKFVLRAQSQNQASGRNGPRLLPFKAPVSDSPIAGSEQHRPRTTPVKTTVDAFGVAASTTASKTNAFTPSQSSTTNTSRNVNQRESQPAHSVSKAGAFSWDRSGPQDMNNNVCEFNSSSGRSTWPRNPADCQLLDDVSATSPDENAGRSHECSRRRFAGSRRRPSLSTVQHAWAEQSMRRATVDNQMYQNLNNPLSAASSYDQLDTVDDAADSRYGQFNSYPSVWLMGYGDSATSY